MPRDARQERDGFRACVRASAALALLGVALLCLMIAGMAVPALLQEGDGHALSATWNPAAGQFGILAMLAGSAALALGALCLGGPLSLALICWQLCPENSGALARQSRRVMGALLHFMTAVPTVVYGFAAVFLLTPFLRGTLGGSGFCLAGAALMLALLVVPTMTLVLRAGLAPRLDALMPHGAALGLSRLQLLWHFVLPRSGSTLLAAGLLGFARALGDTLLPLMLSGNTPQLPQGPASGVRALTAHMAMTAANETGGAACDSLFAAGFLLLCANALTSLVARRLAGNAPEENARP